MRVMFRHPNFKNINGTTDDFALEKKIDQSIRYFQVPLIKEKEDVLNVLLNRINATEKVVPAKNNVIRFYYSAASIAAVALVIFALHFFLTFETYHGVQNASNVYYLPDNSRVVLAEGAQLRYPKNSFRRTVKLKGEAYFEVEHNKKSSFYVKTREGGVLVLGTRFSVSDLNNQLMVQCYQGTVGVDYRKGKIRIVDGMQLLGQNNLVDVNENNNIGYPDYAIFNFTCNAMKLCEVWPILEAYFGVSIVDNVQANKMFTGAINTGNIVEVMDIICTSMELDFNIENQKTIEVNFRN